MTDLTRHLAQEVHRLSTFINELMVAVPLTKPRTLGRWLRARLGAKWCVVWLLMLPCGFGIAHFGPRAAGVIGLSVALCVASGILIRHLEGRAWRLLNAGTLITGLLLGLTLSADTPVWMIVIGALVAELVGKTAFWGFGRNLFNPAALGRAAVALCELYDPPVRPVDLVTAPSPLFKDAGGYLPPHLVDLLMGWTPGAIGEPSAIVLIVAGVPMMLWVARKRLASVAMVGTVLLVLPLLPVTADVAGHAPWVLNPLFYVLGSATLLNAVFFLTDPATTPNTRPGAIVFGVGVGTLGVLGRVYTTLPGAEMWALLVMNAATPLLDRLGPRPFSLPDPRRGADATPHSLLHGASSFVASEHNEPGRLIELDVRMGRVAALTAPETAAFQALAKAIHDPQAIRDDVEHSGLTGCGGAHFPVFRKWGFALKNPGPRALIINGQEGEPGSLKDRYLMQHHPHLVVEGAALAATALSADEITFVIDPHFTAGWEGLTTALADLHSRFPDLAGRCRLVKGPRLYVCGEETALIALLEGNRPEPQLRPPFPTDRGLHGWPTVVHNVETMSWLPRIMHLGGAAFAETGPFKLVVVNGDVQLPGVYTVRLGMPLGGVIELAGGLKPAPEQGGVLQAFAAGGPSGGFLPAHLSTVRLDNQALREVGAALGSGTIRVMNTERNLLLETLHTAEFFADASCGRCTPCRVGTVQLRELLRGLADLPEAERDSASADRELMLQVAHLLTNASTCGLGKTAANRLASLNRYWPELFGSQAAEEHA